MAKNRAQSDSVAQKSGADHDRYFLRTVIAHHRERIAMVDRPTAHLARAEVRTMADEMKATQQREIQEMKGMLSAQ